MAETADLYLAEVGDSYSRENFRRLREVLRDLEAGGRVALPAALISHGGDEVDRREAVVSAAAGEWTKIYTGNRPVVGFRVTLEDGIGVLLDSRKVSGGFEVRSNVAAELRAVVWVEV